MKLFNTTFLIAALAALVSAHSRAMEFEVGMDTIGYLAQDMFESIPTPLVIGVEGLALAAVSYGTYQVGKETYVIGNKLWKVGNTMQNLTNKHTNVISTIALPIRVAGGVVKFFNAPSNEKTNMLKHAWPNVKTASKNVVKIGWNKLTKKKE